MINELKELVSFVENSRSKKLVGSIDQLSTMCRKLFDVIRDNRNVTDEIASMALYNELPSGAYYNIRRRLFTALLESILNKYPDQGASDGSYDAIRDQCISQAATVRILQTKGLNKNLLFISENLLKTSLKYEFNDINTELLKVLLDIFGCNNRNKRKFEKYLKIYNRIEEVRIIEDKIQVAYYKYFSGFEKIKSEPSLSELHSEIDVLHLEQLIIRNLSFKVNFFAYNILCLYYLAESDYSGLKDVAGRGYEFVKSTVQGSKRLAVFFLDRRLTAEIKLNQRDEIWSTIQEIELWISEKSNTFFVIGIYKCLLNLHEQEYASAYNKVRELKRHGFFKELPKDIAEYLELINGYLVLLLKGDFFKSDYKPSFRIYKFLNDVPGYQKDKRGANISIIILHIMFLLVDRKIDDIIDRVDALRLYSYRYLSKNSSFRSNCYIKMLIKMTKANFHPVRTELLAKDLRVKLVSMPAQITEQPLEIEIIPYENLWEITLQLLERNSKIRRGRPKKLQN